LKRYLTRPHIIIFIIWDKLFGTFVAEDEPVKYGLVKAINSVNPLVAFFHGFYRLGKNMINADNLSDSVKYFFAPPEWKPGKK